MRISSCVCTPRSCRRPLSLFQGLLRPGRHVQGCCSPCPCRRICRGGRRAGAPKVLPSSRPVLRLLSVPPQVVLQLGLNGLLGFVQLLLLLHQEANGECDAPRASPPAVVVPGGLPASLGVPLGRGRCPLTCCSGSLRLLLLLVDAGVPSCCAVICACLGLVAAGAPVGGVLAHVLGALVAGIHGVAGVQPGRPPGQVAVSSPAVSPRLGNLSQQQTEKERRD